MIICILVACVFLAFIAGWVLGVMAVASLKRKYLKRVPLSQVKAMYADAYASGRLNSEQVAALFELLD